MCCLLHFKGPIWESFVVTTLQELTLTCWYYITWFCFFFCISMTLWKQFFITLRCFIVVLFDLPSVWNTPCNLSIVFDLIGVYPELLQMVMWFHSMISMGFRNSTKAPSMCELFFIILLNGKFHDLQGFIRPRWLFGISEPSTVTLAKHLPFRAF